MDCPPDPWQQLAPAQQPQQAAAPPAAAAVAAAPSPLASPAGAGGRSRRSSLVGGASPAAGGSAATLPPVALGAVAGAVVEGAAALAAAAGADEAEGAVPTSEWHGMAATRTRLRSAVLGIALVQYGARALTSHLLVCSDLSFAANYPLDAHALLSPAAPAGSVTAPSPLKPRASPFLRDAPPLDLGAFGPSVSASPRAGSGVVAAFEDPPIWQEIFRWGEDLALDLRDARRVRHAVDGQAGVQTCERWL